MEREKTAKLTAVLLLFALLFGDFLAWRSIATGKTSESAIYFLDVGQGDSEVLALPDGVTIMTDAGPDRTVLESLATALPTQGRIDLAVISHPQMDHFNGFNFLLDKYEFGAFAINGRADSPGVGEWQTLISKIRDKNIPLLTLGAGDKIRYGENSIEILSPDPQILDSGELNDTGLVEYIKTKDWKALLLADISKDAEKYVFQGISPLADILKIAHHGSKYSTTNNLLLSTRPRVAVIEVGARNTYGHPALDTLNLLQSFHVKTFRTDLNGTIKFTFRNGKLLAEKLK